MNPSFEIQVGDAIAFLRELPDESIDAVVTDPLYCSGASREADRGRSKEQGSPARLDAWGPVVL